MLTRWCAVLIALLSLASQVAGQEVRGRVMAVDGDAPLAGALLSLVDGDSVVRATTLSDSTGAFLLRAPAGDSLKLRVQRLGYAAMESLPIALQAGDSLRLEIHMRPVPLALEGVTVTGEVRLRPELDRFLRRRRSGFGMTLGPDELRGLPRGSAAILLSSVPGAFLFPGAANTVLAQGRGGRMCQPDVYIDRLSVETAGSSGPAAHGFGVPVSSYVRAEEIIGVEVFRNPAQAPPEYQYAFMPDCPVILIWTNLSFGVGR